MIKTNLNDEEKLELFEFRYKILHDKLNWIPTNENRLDMDSYDNKANHFCLYEDGKLLATIRLLESNNEYMLENEFNYVISKEYELDKNNSVELSRLCVSDNCLDSYCELLFHTVYDWCIENNIEKAYIVTTRGAISKLKGLKYKVKVINKKDKNNIFAVIER